VRYADESVAAITSEQARRGVEGWRPIERSVAIEHLCAIRRREFCYRSPRSHWRLPPSLAGLADGTIRHRSHRKDVSGRRCERRATAAECAAAWWRAVPVQRSPRARPARPPPPAVWFRFGIRK
jgi:hypothetical protein